MVRCKKAGAADALAILGVALMIGYGAYMHDQGKWGKNGTEAVYKPLEFWQEEGELDKKVLRGDLRPGQTLFANRPKWNLNN